MRIGFIIVSLPLVLAADSSIRVFHRLYQPGLPESPFIPRGTVHLSSSGHASFEPSPSLAQDLTQLSEALQTISGTQYQIALDDTNPGQWDIVSSVKVCHLNDAAAEKFIVHTTRGGKPYALDYFVAPTPHNGACPKKSKAPTPLLSFAKNIPVLNTTVEMRSPRTPPLPELRVPPPLTPEGQPVVPEPEKTFFQRYWLYGAAILIALLLSGGPEEEQKK